MEEDIQEDLVDSFFVPGFKDASNYSQEALRSILMATKSANSLPSAGDDFDYYSTFPGFREVMFRKRQAILSLMTSLIQGQGIREKFQGQESDEKYDLLVESNDAILENVSNYLDDAAGLKKTDDVEEELVLAVKPQSHINTSWNKKQFSSFSPQSYKLITAKNVSRPQLSFKDKIDNSNTPFVPIIKDKPNSIKPLAIILENDGEKEEYCHPYEWEIEKFTPPEEILNTVEPKVPKPVEETPLVYVNTLKQLKEICEELKKEKELAVDLEHHSYRSFQGFTCLMQLSTREKDYIVDALELRSDLHLLNDVFTDPKIVKVLHGADMDVQWLQRDFGLYIVNLFDTGQAARVLNFAHLSLSYLLKHFCKLDVDKRFQLADWRVRPLPKEMIKYAREDTHYLLYVYDCLKNDLIENGNEMKNLLLSTFERSKLICAKKYEKPLFTEDKYLEFYKKSRKNWNLKQLQCLKDLYLWRDTMARENDESAHYVLPNHMMLQIAEVLPKEQQGILACCNPIPPLVKQQLNELHSIILKANDNLLKLHDAMAIQNTQTPKAFYNHIDLSSLVHCPHDIHQLEDRKLQTTNESGSGDNLLPILNKSQSSISLLKKEPVLSALFDNTLNKAQSTQKKIPETVVDVVKKLISPFQRYKISEEMREQESGSKRSTEEETTVEAVPLETTNNSLNESQEVADVSQTDGDSSQLQDASIEIIESTPIRKRNKRKRKSKPVPDVSLISTPNEQPQKKFKTPEVVAAEDNFTPYDYSQSDMSGFSGKKKQKERNQERSNYQTPRPFFGKKRKHAKQSSFTKGSGSDHNAKWPKNK